MKILQVNKFFYLKGGSEAYLFSLIDGLKSKGYSIAEFAMQSEKNKPSQFDKEFVSEIDYDTDKLSEKIKYGIHIFYSIEAKLCIRKILYQFKPDLVHLHMFQHQMTSSILPEIKRRKIPIVYTAHDLKSICPNYKMLSHGIVCEACRGHKYYNCVLKQCVKHSYLKSTISSFEQYLHLWLRYYDLIDLIITPSQFYRHKLIDFRFPEKKVVHIPNFVNEDMLQAHYSHDNYFIYLGRLSEEKGILTLVHAMSKVPNGNLKIIGTGPMKNEIEQLIQALGLRNIELVGFQSGKNLTNLMKNAMFTVIPSEWYENGSISLLESFAFGKPVIGSNIGGIPEHITEKKNGLIFQAKNSEDLASKINWMLKNQDQYYPMAAFARTTMEKKYSKEVHLRSITKSYESLIDKC